MYVLEDLWRECYSPEVKQSRRGSEYHRLAQGLAERRAELLPLLSAEAQSTLERFERTKDTFRQSVRRTPSLRASAWEPE